MAGTFSSATMGWGVKERHDRQSRPDGPPGPVCRLPYTCPLEVQRHESLRPDSDDRLYINWQISGRVIGQGMPHPRRPAPWLLAPCLLSAVLAFFPPPGFMTRHGEAFGW
jgi:hypothetical protein